MRRPVPRWIGLALLAVAVVLAASLLIEPGRFKGIGYRISLRGEPGALLRGCEVIALKKDGYRSFSPWQRLKGFRSFGVSLVDRTHSGLGVVYSIPVGIYVDERVREVWVRGWGELDEPIASVIKKIESNAMVSEFVRVTGATEATFGNKGVVFTHGGYELVYAPPNIHGLEAERGVYSYVIPNRKYRSFRGVRELRRKAKEAGFTIPSDARVVYGRYGGWFVKWNPPGCGKDTLIVSKPREGEPAVRWISSPTEIDPSLMEPSIHARLAQMGLTREYVLSNFRLLEKKGVRQANHVRKNGKVIDKTKVIGRLTYQWVTGTPWVDSLAGGCKVHALFTYRVDRPDSLYLRVGPSALESSTRPRLHKIDTLISYETALEKLPQFGEEKERFFIKVYPNGNSRGRGMIFLSSGHLRKHRGYVEIDLETGEVNRGAFGMWCMIPEEIRQFGAVAVRGWGLY